MPLSHFASRLRKDLSTEMIRTSIAHRKSLSQKENRHKVYERNRHFGLRDVNIPLEGRDLVNIPELPQSLAPEKASSKTKSEKMVLSDQRKQLLQKYKEEKHLQKLKEQREKAKRGVFKVGLYRPDAPGFLVTDNRSVKAEPEKAFSYTGRITRSKAKDHMEHTKIDSKNALQAARFGQKQTSEKKIPDKERKAVQSMVSSGKMTGAAATQRTKQMTRAVPSATSKPVSRVAGENESERVGPGRGRPARKVDAKPDKVIPSKGASEENRVGPQSSVTSGTGQHGVFPAVGNLPRTVPAKAKQRNSFAPEHCVFQPPRGLKTYPVALTCHRSDHALLTPWSPLKLDGSTTQDSANGPLVQTSVSVQQESNNVEQDFASPAACDEEHVLNQKEAPATNSSRLSEDGATSQPQHDVPYFRTILQSETDRLTSHCLEWDRKLDLDIPDDAKDLIRTTVGQTRLLIMERFKQFEGLIDNCEYKRGEKETTCSDLDGFWDMVNFQKKIVPGGTNRTKQDDAGRLAARNRLAAIKNAMKARLKQEEHAPVAAVETPKEVDKIVFDAGFFRIESPVKSFSALSSERRSQRFGAVIPASRVMPESGAAGDLQRQRRSLENPDPQSSKCEGVNKTLFSDTLESRSSRADDTWCPGEQESSALDHVVNKINVEMDCFPAEVMNLPLPAGRVAGDTKQREVHSDVEGVELQSTSQDVLMSDPEKSSPSPDASEEDSRVSQSEPLHRQLNCEPQLLDPPALSNASPCTQVESRQQGRARHISFGGDLIVFSPVRLRSQEHQEGF
ncbi:disks large-associated protein 5 [Microtus ochrogaster]|uniref:Disks large-associated protein 5 n=1 Tax=Microtus ochrogaster TaxID=79684 RepID=A0ABM0KYP9_MICOH|nr:disks large-associated protein 5 [Microtus ochrogaster]